MTVDYTLTDQTFRALMQSRRPGVTILGYNPDNRFLYFLEQDGSRLNLSRAGPFDTQEARATQPVSGTVDASPATLAVTATAAVNTAVTASLPAVVGQFHCIVALQVQKLYSVVGVAAGAGIIITTTNLPGTPAFTTEQLASAAGTVVTVVNFAPTTPLRSSVSNTATTVVCPAQLQTIWRINVWYFPKA